MKQGELGKIKFLAPDKDVTMWSEPTARALGYMQAGIWEPRFYSCPSKITYAVYQEVDNIYIEWDLQCRLTLGHPYPAVPHEAPDPIIDGNMRYWEDRFIS